ncbi:oxidoreductase FAD-binding domain/oxidoreductase NAD-bindingdomain/2Fe-2S iron-sulfur cluster binding domain protein [Marinomonas sp. MED121]|uniref:hybrid-cluster NAD(P)-dependent oxidoreductase n=1 Tax=Marinomonas sp. MED121 TaxID=314277 RepID=UPI000068FC10|nr:hybrid-cluster NAD(P)-dependent oxidoreductase [Marinomonas sp. MED121]EAQ63849.1 oxidoreductase FAD-binding domain/oxidoreductase NAD-bindingdomain/2Fe-2S iron-sulfur cluster binding domain protein [Marinomonas sp. MED121]
MNDTFLNTVNTQTWANGRHQVRCVNRIWETPDVTTFCFMAEQPIMFFFKPGQFVTLELMIEGEQVMRSYTIASSPSVPYSFSITVKRVPGGQVSNWLHDNLTEGDELAVHGPMGVFNCIDYPAEKVLLLSGGSGITPTMSMARWLYDTNTGVDMVFCHSARTPTDIIFRRELELMDSRVNNLQVNFICETHGIGETWAGYRGYLDLFKLQLMAPDFKERTVFCCGPAPYMAAVKKMLKDADFPMENYFEESFGEPPADADLDILTEAQEEALEDRSEGAMVSFTNIGKGIKVKAEETVHSAATQLGIRIPKACGMGICGTCRVLKVSGEVEMEHNGGITDDDVAEGYILSCCSKPKTDVEIEV